MGGTYVPDLSHHNGRHPQKPDGYGTVEYHANASRGASTMAEHLAVRQWAPGPWMLPQGRATPARSLTGSRDSLIPLRIALGSFVPSTSCPTLCAPPPCQRPTSGLCAHPYHSRSSRRSTGTTRRPSQSGTCSAPIVGRPTGAGGSAVRPWSCLSGRCRRPRGRMTPTRERCVTSTGPSVFETRTTNVKDTVTA
jgi:hypothetical protein